MSVAKVIELTADSSKSFEDAIQEGIERATESVDDVQGAWVQDQEVIVNKGKITGYRVHLRVTFIVGGKKKK
jgi:flavin-binding protein dodecin